MDDYSIKVISWIGISFVTTYRTVLLKPPERVLVPVERGGLISNRRERNEGFPCLPEPSTEQTLRNLIKQDTDNLMKWIRGDVQAIHKLMKGNDKKIPEWTKGETNTLYESMKFQMISFNRQPSLLTFQLIVVENLTTDQETLIKWVEENDKMCTVCSEEDKRILTEWISDNQQTITESITKDTMKFYDMIQGLDDTLDEKTKQDIKKIINRKGRSSINTYRHYNIVLSKTSNKNTMIEIGDRALCELGCPSALNITSTKVELKWDEPSVGAEFIDFYKIMCEEKRICVTCFFETPGNSCTYVVEGLKPNTEYAFKIQAVKNCQNRGPFSETLTVPTLEISCDRLADALFEPGCPSALHITSTKVELTWDEPSVDADLMDFYKIMCEETGICVTCFFETPGNSCTYVVEGLKPNTEYAFKIQAVKNGQNRGPFSNTLTVSTLEISCDREAELVALCEPGCPSALNITSTKVELQWDEPSVGAEFIDFYKIMCEEKRTCVTCFFETPGNSCTYVVEGLKPNTDYAFKIQAVKNGQNRGPFSETLTVPTFEISCDRMAELVYVLFYIAVLVWFTYLFFYTVTTT